MDESRELAEAFASGEAWAYEAAYRMHAGLLQAAARSVLRDRDEAQDCVHDVLTRLWQRGNAYRIERGSLRAFLAVCVRNEALSRARTSSHRANIAQRLPPVPDEPDPSDAIAERETVGNALRSLNEKERGTLEMAYYEGLTHEQIAQRTGEPVGTIKSRLSSALRRLRAYFAQPESSHV
ncbi:MAG: sigma-70 family RNA polymerase sigma factor [Candidatus Eremiobacteraeota bacterium]|nr:sigma-70 family RNA polymerase sigma factor [Candidatus Eremiobacteraeota bacterium]